MGTVRKAYRSRRAADFLHRDNMRKITKARTAVLFLDRNSEHSEITKFGPKTAWKFVADINLTCERHYMSGRKATDRCTQQVDIFAKSKVEIEHF